jgi:hypothetical protein
MHARPIRSLTALLLALLLWPAGLSADGGRWVEAEGVGVVDGDSARARRAAIAEALIAAGRAAGAEVRSFTALDRGRITADFTTLRSTMRIHAHEVIAAAREGDVWRVRVRARVGPVPPHDCAPRRRLDVIAFAPEIAVDPAAPAWTAPLVETLFQEILDHVAATPDADLTRVTDRRQGTLPAPERAGFDYRSLTEGAAPRRAGAHALLVRLDVTRASGRAVRLSARVTLRAETGEAITLTLARRTAAAPPGALARALGPDRRRRAAALSEGVVAGVGRMLARMTCRPPVARLARSGGDFSVPLGRRHGLSGESLGFVESGARTTVFEILRLDRDSATLRPLDRSRPAAALTGRIVTFMEAG